MRTRMDTLRNKITWLAALLLVAPLAANGITVTERFTNGNDITHLFFWAEGPVPDMNFVGVDLGNPTTDPKLNGWVSSPTPSPFPANTFSLVLAGPEIKNNLGKFDIDFNHTNATFTFHFAEVLYDGVGAFDETTHIQETGSIFYDGKKLINPTAYALSTGEMLDVTTYFASGATAVPIPSSVVLMMSAVGFMGIASRRVIVAKTTDSD